MQSIYNHSDTRQMAQVINDLVRQFDNTGSVSLTNSTTSTVVSNPKVLPSSVVILQETSPAAFAAQAYVSAKANGQFTITHLSATTTRTFDYVIFGV
ncbi:hypothetical protein QM996_02570 [Sinorhizobium chiapasense]